MMNCGNYKKESNESIDNNIYKQEQKTHNLLVLQWVGSEVSFFSVPQEPHRVYPSIPANQRRPLRVLSLFDGIATGESTPPPDASKSVCGAFQVSEAPH